MNYITINIADKPNNEELKRRVSESLNGDYANLVCRTCGFYSVDPEASIENMKIVEICSICFKP